MKMLNKKFVRTLSCAAVAVCAAAMLSVGAFAAEADINDPAAAGYLPPQEQMVQGDIALHSADVAVGEKDPSYGGYGAPEGNPIQGNIMLISGDELADTAKTEARYTVKGLLGKQLLYTARQKDGVLTLDVPAPPDASTVLAADAPMARLAIRQTARSRDTSFFMFFIVSSPFSFC